MNHYCRLFYKFGICSFILHFDVEFSSKRSGLELATDHTKEKETFVLQYEILSRFCNTTRSVCEHCAFGFNAQIYFVVRFMLSE